MRPTKKCRSLHQALRLLLLLGLGTLGFSAELPLADAERAYLAEIEHRALTLNKKGFPAIKSALREGNSQRLMNYLSDGFHGKWLDFSERAGLSGERLRIRKGSGEEAGAEAKNLSSEAFTKQLLGLRSEFSGELVLEIKLLDFAPRERGDLNGVWEGLCQLRMAGPARGGGTQELLLTLQVVFARIPDVDAIAEAAGWIEALRVQGGHEVWAAEALLPEVARERGIDPERFWDNWKHPPERATTVSGGVYLADIDADGREDVLFTDLNGLFLFRATPEGRFVDVTEQAGLPRHARSVVNAVFGDFDGNGFPDLILDHRVYRNVGGRFQDISQFCNLRFGSTHYLLGYTVGDYDRDGLLDLYATRSYGAQGRYGKNSWIDGPGGPGNQLWRNLGNWRFEDVSDAAQARAGRRSAFTASWLDANDDGWPDLYVINEFGGGVLLVNQKNGAFREQSLTGDAGDFGSMGLMAADFNNDGRIDIYAANMYSKSGRRIVGNLAENAYQAEIMAKMKTFFPGSELYQNQGGLQFERVGQAMGVRAVGWAYGPAFVDLDNDGFLDLYATSGFVSVNRDEPDG